MRTFTPEMTEHLKGETTTLCRCWILETALGGKLGFTDHDRSINIEGIRCEKDAGIETSGIEEQLGLNVDSSEVAGALQSDFIREQDIAAGHFDNAKVSMYLVNWNDPSQYFLDQVSLVGEIHREDGHYRMELRGLSSQLDQSRGNHFVKRCQADLGDRRCKVNVSVPSFLGAGYVLSVRSQFLISVSDLSDFKNGWFRNGRLTWIDGNNAGRKIGVAEHIKSAGEVVLHLWQPMPSSVSINDQFSIAAGCDKDFSTCQRKFSNVQNFRGFPHIPGNDFALNYAANSDQFDGGPIVS